METRHKSASIIQQTISTLNGLCLSTDGDETKLQSFNLKEILKRSWDFT